MHTSLQVSEVINLLNLFPALLASLAEKSFERVTILFFLEKLLEDFFPKGLMFGG